MPKKSSKANARTKSHRVSSETAPRNAKSVQAARTDLGIIVDLIPRTNSNRPGTPLHAAKITIHNTDNSDPRADARAHCAYQKGADAQRRQVSWHFSVDDKSIYQSLPVDEVGWHAGSHQGNATSIGIEICENQGIDQQAADDRAAQLTALQLHELGISLEGNVVQHHDWSGKNCPALLRQAPSGWRDFLEAVAGYYTQMPQAPAENEHVAPFDLFGDREPGTSGPGRAPVFAAGSFQAGILSTEFGGGSEAGMPSAYGGTINPNEPQASLPSRVARSRRQIEVSNPGNGRKVSCLVNDVGPWNTHDSYWDHGTRPAAESQFEQHQKAENGRVPSNRAGLDLTPAAMLALGVSGAVNTRQVTVNWQFL